ncbi:MAG: cytochrome P450 [Acidimicrobiales bacterium]
MPSEETIPSSAGKRAFDPISQVYIGEPGDYLRQARESDPVFFAQEFGCWVFTRYEDIQNALLDYSTYSNATLADAPVPEVFQDRVPVDFFARSFNALDPPAHAPVRKAGRAGFTAPQMASLAEPIQSATASVLDSMATVHSCDLMPTFCHEVAHRTIATLLGLPETDIPLLKQLAEDLPRVFTDHLTPMDEQERLERWGRVASLRDYFEEVVASRREAPSTDFVSMLIQASGEDGAPLLSTQRIITHMTEIVFAGTDTTANLIARMVLLFDQHPDQLRFVQQEPARMADAIEEGLRLRGTVNGLFRRTTRAVEVSGTVIPPDSQVYLAIASADRDEARFSQADVFDIRRVDAGRHLSFGSGRHLCLGAPLARLEARIALTSLYERYPTLKVVASQTLEYDPILLSVMLKRLWVEW